MKKFLHSLLLAFATLTTPAVVMAAQVRHDRAEAAQQSVTVEVVHSGIEIGSNASDTVVVTVYTITGTSVKTISLQSGDKVTIDVPAGYYIVKTPQRSIRVLVR